jgi:hypothetical protein
MFGGGGFGAQQPAQQGLFGGGGGQSNIPIDPVILLEGMKRTDQKERDTTSSLF